MSAVLGRPTSEARGPTSSVRSERPMKTKGYESEDLTATISSGIARETGGAAEMYFAVHAGTSEREPSF